MPRIRVAVCGSSLHMVALAASLRANPNVEVSCCGTGAEALARDLDALAPAMVAFDLDDLPGELAIALLRDRPELLLIGIDPSSEKILLLSGRQEEPLSAAELVQMLAGEAAAAPSARLQDTEGARTKE